LDFRGVFSVLPTPFMKTGEVDVASLGRVVDLCVGAGVKGVTALGVTGEVSRLSESERLLIVETVTAHVHGRIDVLAGTTADGQLTCIEYSRKARSAGATAVMVSPPRMPKLNSDAVFKHFAELASAIDCSIVVQDYPPISGYAMEPALLARIAREIPAARTIKLEDPPTPLNISRILEQCEGVPVQVLGGLGGVFLLEELLAGAAGAMTGFAFPEALVEVVKRFHAGDVDGAADVFYRYIPLIRFEFQEGIGLAIRKEIYRRRGALVDAYVRPPGSLLDTGTGAALDRLLNWMRQKEEVLWISD
jgi:4-hydroxy-tetrahydrodipicolinate synthase